MDRISKFLQKLDPRLRDRIVRIAFDITAGKTTGLDIKPLKGEKNLYRCRIGNIRLIFMKVGQIHTLIDVDFRGQVYKKR